MPEKEPSRSQAGEDSAGKTKSWSGIVQTVKTPLGLLALSLLVINGTLATALVVSIQQGENTLVPLGIIVCFVITFLAFMRAFVHMFRHDVRGLVDGHTPRPLPVDDLTDSHISELTTEELGATTTGIVGEDQPGLKSGVWYDELRPVLHQASQYTAPTYFLDVNLNMIDWNIAFELIFSDIVGDLRGRHVKFFIARLANVNQVMDHAQEFTKQVFRGNMPFVDIEPLCYASENYGDVQFVKVATQLHDADGVLRAWSVALMIDRIRWEAFEEDLLEAIRNDKLWSVYSAAYDHVLLEFPPYLKLIEDVIDVVPDGKCVVADLGAGTGNATMALLEKDHTVTAVENNVGMLNRLRAKRLPRESVRIVKSSADRLEELKDDYFDAVVMVNVLYAVSEPLKCLQDVHRILKPHGVLGFSTTHSEIDLDPLLNRIRARLREIGKYDELSTDYQMLYELNKSIETTIAKKHTRDDYRQWTRVAGFEITKDVPSTYEDAVMLIHARKT